MKILPLTVAVLLAGPVLPTFAADAKVGAGRTAPATQNRIVIQINEDSVRKWNDVLVNIHNI